MFHIFFLKYLLIKFHISIPNDICRVAPKKISNKFRAGKNINKLLNIFRLKYIDICESECKNSLLDLSIFAEQDKIQIK